MAAGSTGERPFFEIITSIRYWVIHAVTLPKHQRARLPW